MPTKADLAQIRINTLIEHLPGPMRSDVLSDPDVATAVGGVHHPVKLSSDIVISREELFHTLRDLFDGTSVTISRGSRVIGSKLRSRRSPTELAPSQSGAHSGGSPTQTFSREILNLAWPLSNEWLPRTRSPQPRKKLGEPG